MGQLQSTAPEKEWKSSVKNQINETKSGTKHDNHQRTFCQLSLVTKIWQLSSFSSAHQFGAIRLGLWLFSASCNGKVLLKLTWNDWQKMAKWWVTQLIKTDRATTLKNTYILSFQAWHTSTSFVNKLYHLAACWQCSDLFLSWQWLSTTFVICKKKWQKIQISCWCCVM